MLLEIVTIAVAGLVGLLLVVAAVGALLPKAHLASRVIHLRQPPQEVWHAIADVDRFPAWRPGLLRIERLADTEGHARWKEYGRHGAITFELLEATPPSKMVTRIADPSLPFGGSWSYVLEPTAEGTSITITERGEVTNPVFRFLSRFVFGHTATIDGCLRGLARKFGEDTTPRDA